MARRSGEELLPALVPANNNDGSNSVVSFVRHGTKPEDILLVVANMTPVPRPNYRVGVPHEGLWAEILNTNAKRYGGEGAGHAEPVQTSPTKCDGRLHSIDLTLPGMSTLFFLFRPLLPATK